MTRAVAILVALSLASCGQAHKEGVKPVRPQGYAGTTSTCDFFPEQQGETAHMICCDQPNCSPAAEWRRIHDTTIWPAPVTGVNYPVDVAISYGTSGKLCQVPYLSDGAPMQGCMCMDGVLTCREQTPTQEAR